MASVQLEPKVHFSCGAYTNKPHLEPIYWFCMFSILRVYLTMRLVYGSAGRLQFPANQSAATNGGFHFYILVVYNDTKGTNWQMIHCFLVLSGKESSPIDSLTTVTWLWRWRRAMRRWGTGRERGARHRMRLADATSAQCDSAAPAAQIEERQLARSALPRWTSPPLPHRSSLHRKHTWK